MPRDPTIRFGVRDTEGRESAVWRLWVVAQKSEVYIAGRRLGGEIKVSLHASGDWRVAFADPRSPLIPEGDDRIIHRWGRPAEIAPGWARGFEIGIPGSEVTDPAPDADHHPDTAWEPAAGSGRATNFDVFFARGDAADLTNGWPGRDAMGTRLLFAAPMANGETVVLLVHEGEMPISVREGFAQYLPAMREDLANAGEGDGGLIRAFMIGTVDADGTPFFLDVRDPRDINWPTKS